MNVKTIYGVWPMKFFRIRGIVLYPLVLFRDTKEVLARNKWDAQVLFKHEFIHVEQIERLGWFNFYWSYLKEHFSKGYRKNKFEIEAFHRQAEPMNLRERFHFEKDFAGLLNN